MPRATAFCDQAILSPQLMEVHDTHLDARFRDSPLAMQDPAWRFYAGVPFSACDGHRIGTLAVADHAPRALSESQRSNLQQLAAVLVQALEIRKQWLRAGKLGEMLDRSLNEIYVFDAQTMRFEYVSQGAQYNTGYSMRELGELTPHDLQPELNAEAFRHAVTPLLKGERDYIDFPSLCRRKDGSTYPVDARLQLCREDGRPRFVAIVNDVTERVRAQAQARECYAAMDGAMDGMAILDRNETYTYLNRAHARLFGYDDPNQLIGKNWRELYAPQEAERIEREVFPLLAHNRRWVGEATAKRRDGSTFDESLALTLLDEGNLICICRDVSAEKAAAEAVFREKELAEVTLKSIGDAVITTDTIGRVTYLNPVAETMTGWPDAQARGKPLAQIFKVIEAATRQPTLNPVEVALAQNRVVGLATDSCLMNRYGTEIAIEDSAAPIHDRAGNVIGGVLIFRDVSETRTMALRMAHLAQHDALTDLPNRVLLMDRFARAKVAAWRNDQKLALLFVDLDHFKHVNDSLGHEAGDVLLKEIARRLRSCVRETDTVSRQGGDEFAVLVEGLNDAADAAQVASKILQACAAPFGIDGHELHIGASIGISLLPDDGEELDLLSRNADAAMYHAKRLGRNNFEFYAPAMNASAKERLQLRNNLRRALANDEFELHYQPRVDMISGSIVGAEALLRWRDPQRGLLLPGEFIPLAEETGLIVTIGHWVLGAACKQMGQWRKAGLLRVPISVNVSAAQFRRTDFYDDVCDSLEHAGLNGAELELELTESTLIQDAEATAKVLCELKRLGVRISIDDFGTGYSSLSQLRRFPIDTLKIDRSFVADLTTDADDAAITAAVVSMAKSLRQQVVAEGVESIEQHTFLRALGCDAAQGYYFYRPLPAPAFAQLLDEQARSSEHPMY